MPQAGNSLGPGEISLLAKSGRETAPEKGSKKPSLKRGLDWQPHQDSNLEILNQNQVCYQLHYGAVCSGVSAVAGRSKPHGAQSGKRKMPCLPCLKVNAPA